jgi:hypothetical protein
MNKGVTVRNWEEEKKNAKIVFFFLFLEMKIVEKQFFLLSDKMTKLALLPSNHNLTP